MVKLDLERVGILYETDDGIADFHASGRHSYVTGLLRHGATLAEAKELARHSDVRITMRYTHIGLQDQANALASLPTTQAKPADAMEVISDDGDHAGQQSGQHSRGPDGHAASRRGTSRHKTKKKPEAANAADNGTSDASSHSAAESGTDSAEWRRRESNEGPEFCNALCSQELGVSRSSCAAFWQCSNGTNCQVLAGAGTPSFIVQSWTKLPPHIREAIVTLVDSAVRGRAGGAQ